MNRFRRQPATAPAQPTRKASSTRAIMVNGKYQTIAELRSSYGNGLRLVQNGQGIVSGDYTAEELANVYKTGLTTFIGINTRCGISAEIPVRCIDFNDEVVEDGPAQSFIKNSPKFIWRLLAHNIIWGEIYILKVRNRHGYTSGLEILSPLDVEPEMDYSRGVVRRYRVYRSNGAYEFIHPDDMIVDITFNPFSDIDGTGALEPAKVRNDIETNIGRYGAMFFANSARPDLIINTEDDLDEPELIAAKKSYEASFKGVLNSFRAWFAAGRKYTITPVSTNPVDLALVELDARADMKILAAIKCNPILAGIGTASDPLSSQGTYEQVRRQQVDFVAIPDVRGICNILNEQWLHSDFPNGADRYRLEPNLAEIQSDSLGTGERVTTAAAAVSNRVWTVNEARKYTGKEPLQYAVSINPEWSWGNWDRGLMTRKQVLLAQGYDSATIAGPDGYIYELDPRFKVAGQNLQPPPAAYFPNPGIQRSLPATVPPPEPQPENVLTIEPAPPRRNADALAQVEELRLWSKRVKKSGVSARFSVECITPAIAAFVRSNLADGWSSASVFEAAKLAVRTGEPPQIGITPEDANAYWQDYDGLESDIRDAWLQSYMSKVWSSVRPELRDGLTDLDLQTILDQHHETLTAEWVGDAKNPGSLQALVLAGMVAGNKALSTGNAARPQRATPSIQFAASFDVLSAEALSFVKQYAFNLIRGIDETTIGLVRQAISDGITNGQSLDVTAQVLDEIFHDSDRARVIAGNESLRAYNAGAFARWQNAGVTQAKWLTVRDSHICPICLRLNGQVANIVTGWTDPATGAIYRELAHVSCRCPKAPVLL